MICRIYSAANLATLLAMPAIYDVAKSDSQISIRCLRRIAILVGS